MYLLWWSVKKFGAICVIYLIQLIVQIAIVFGLLGFGVSKLFGNDLTWKEYIHDVAEANKGLDYKLKEAVKEIISL